MTDERCFYVYGLHYPDGRIFYVGKGKGDRIYDHVTDARAGRCRNKHLQSTILKIERQGGKVRYEKFHQNLSEEIALEKERQLIAEHGRRCAGGTLVNLSEGGEGSSGYKHTEEARRKIGELSRGNTYRRGKKMTEEQRRRVSEGHKGQVPAMKGKTHTEEARAKIKAARALQVSPMKGRKHSEESKQKMSSSKKGITAWNKGVPANPERMAEMHSKWRGCKQTPEAIAKISAASKATWAKRREVANVC